MTKKNRKLIKACIFLLAILMLGSLESRGLEAEAAVKLSANKVTLIKGQKKTLKVKGTKKKAVFSSTRKKIASVGKNGKITARKKGTATIKARIGAKTYRCKVTVEAPKLNKTQLVLKVKQTANLKLSGTSRKVTWKSSKKSVASVNKKGKVTAKKQGSAVITASVGGKRYSCQVQVVKEENQDSSDTKVPQDATEQPVIKVSGITLNKNEITITNGYSQQLTATVQPSNATDQSLRWESSDNGVVSVDANGRITGCSVGTAVVNVACAGVTASCVVHVVAEEPQIGIRLLAQSNPPVYYVILSVTNYRQKPLTIHTPIVFNLEDGPVDLYMADDGDFITSYTMETSGFLRISLCQESLESFDVNVRSDFSFGITYDGIQYIGVADYYGDKLELRKLSDVQKESGVSDYRELLAYALSW